MTAKLIYTIIVSLDGYIEDPEGDITWGAPDEEVSSYINDLQRPVGTHLLGRRMYETMTFWESVPNLDDESPATKEFAKLWLASEKIVFSASLDSVSNPRTRLERTFDPTLIQAMKDSLPHDLSVSGPDLAAQALNAGLVDECELIVVPVLLGGGKPALPHGAHIDLELIEARQFHSGVVLLRYRIVRDGAARR
jgi:dihydrofolate reductase